MIIALNHQKINHHPERISKLIPFISKYNWDGINFPVGEKEWKTFERNNSDIALNILSVLYNKKDIVTQYESKYNFKRKNQVVLLMITDDKGKWHYLALKSDITYNNHMTPRKSIKKLLRRFSSNTMVNFIVWVAYILIEQKMH